MKKKKEQHQPCILEAEILDKRGKTNLEEVCIDVSIDEPETNEVLSFYTYHGQVCILDGLGMDVYFSNYTPETRKIIYDAIMQVL